MLNRTILLIGFVFILGASFTHVIEHGRSWQFVIAAVVSAMAIGYLLATKED
jgi:hypothetical protein